MSSTTPEAAAPVTATDVRLLEGPNLYFTRPALKVTLSMPGYLDAPTAPLRELTTALRLRARVGEPGSAQRRAYLGRLTAHLIRSVAKEAGSSRVGIRVRPGSAPDEVVVAAVWRRRGRAWAIGDRLAEVLADLLAGTEPGPLLHQWAQQVRAAPASRPPTALTPTVPVASITGTNGKTTTTRLLAHLCMTAGRKTAWSSTDGVVVMGTVVEPGDYSGPAGARGVLEVPGLEIGVLETARGGLLLKGMGVTHNDASVVTNVSADHLGMQGVDTLDQLAEVKAIVTTVTKEDGWCVLNGEDPRVWAMHTRTKARPWAFALDPAAPALREAIDLGGRGITLADDAITLLLPGGTTQRLIDLTDVPATLAGLSQHNVANALAAAAAGLALGLPQEAVVEGLATFTADESLNPGRMNIYSLPLAEAGSATVILDLAHNEAGLVALMDVARGLTAPGCRVRLALGTAGDRTDDILTALGQIAGQRADHVVIAHKTKYLRGRSEAEFEELFGSGLALAGVGAVASLDGEVEALAELAGGAVDGDVIAMMTHEHRQACVAWIGEHGGRPDTPADIRRKAVAAKGRHELDEVFTGLWQEVDPQRRIGELRSLRAQNPTDPRVAFEYAGALDAVGLETDAVEVYQSAIAGGLPEPYRHQAQIQLASSLRNLGRNHEAVAALDDLAAQRPESAAVIAFRALARFERGDAGAVVADLIDALLTRATDEDTHLYRNALTRYADELRGGASR